MKKRLIAIIAMVCVAACVLGACGGGNGGNGGGGGAKTEAFDVGAFTVEVPSTWKALPQEDIWADADADGNKPIDPAQILLVKDPKAKDAWDAMGKPNIRIYYYESGDNYWDMRDIYDNVEELTVELNGVACDAYQGDSIGYTYQFILYDTSDAFYEIQVFVADDGKATGITWDDAEVKAMLESITTK